MKTTRRSTRTFALSRKLILTGSILPAALATVVTTSNTNAATVIWGPTETINASATYSEGLKEWRGQIGNGNIDQAANLFTLNTGASGTGLIGAAGSGIVDRPRLGEMNVDPNSNDDGPNTWSDNYVPRYTGQFFDADGIFTFGENIDDQVRVYIDGVLVLSDNGWNNPTRSNNGGANNGNSYGMGPDGNGWHDFELRMQNGGGGAGAVN